MPRWARAEHPPKRNAVARNAVRKNRFSIPMSTESHYCPNGSVRLFEFGTGGSNPNRHHVHVQNLCAKERDFDDFAVLRGLALVLIEYKIAERIEDQAAAVGFLGLDDVRMMADDERCAGVDGSMCKCNLGLGGRAGVFDAVVH